MDFPSKNEVRERYSSSTEISSSSEQGSSSSELSSSSIDVSGSSSSEISSSSEQGSSSSELSSSSSSLPPSSSSSELSSSSSSSVQSSSSVSSSSSPAYCGNTEYNPTTEACCGSDKYNTTTEQCENNNVKKKCGDEWYNASDPNLRCNNNEIEGKCNASWYNLETQFCFNNSKIGNYCGTQIRAYDPDIYVCNFGQSANGIYLKDYSGNVYGAAVLIGNQIWEAQNYYISYSDGGVCYNDDYGTYSRCDRTYGKLYDWATAMVIDNKYNDIDEAWDGSDVNHQGICPTGWHIPSKEDWEILMEFTNSECSVTPDHTSCLNAATKLKADHGWDFCNNTGGGTDDYGFSAFPTGFGERSEYSESGYSYKAREGIGDCGFLSNYLWSSSYDGNQVYMFSMGNHNSDENDVYLSKTPYKQTFYGVRCLKDN